ncbi:type II secretory ATPase GspE/PulE/Tfp pilus assembly ATPase PilB-like protein [Pseudomonas sp. JUb42]|uniref:GspE/PulE family protein n=1 Tax=Pseudomonas sp. JUb42 TaxID=2940611 RepID=UPI002169502C|nr:ATPase, T2SS/T4P/T4SS family [Pseudomonas sp. JUb42]MCS3473053.1 type II secretory ATPase GspE/PulE/Tfp pilus assembly ATPase PilB-like protein [Pseudomonas sp. JUb42]
MSITSLTLGNLLNIETRAKPREADTHVGPEEFSNALQLHTALGTKVLRPFPHIVGPQHAANLCPFQLEGGRWVILATRQFVESDICEACKVELLKRSSAAKVQIYTVTHSLLMTIVEEDASGREADSIPEKEMTAYRAAFQELIEWAFSNKASDVHLNLSNKETESQISFHIHGLYVSPPRWKMPTARMFELLSVAWQWGNGGKGATFSKTAAQQCSLEMVVNNHLISARWASLAPDAGPSVTLRILDTHKSIADTSLEDMGCLPSHIEMLDRAMRAEGGAILLSGVMGSGKTTLLAKLMSLLPRTRKIITVEDPVEYRIPNALQITIRRSLTEDDSKNFTAILRTIRRSAPNDVMLGEIRDTQTGDAMQDLANSGTNLYSTVHAQSPWQIPERLYSKSIGVPNDLLASPGVLKLLVFMALLPRLCEHCALPLHSLAENGGVDAIGKHRDKDYWVRYIERIHRIYDGIDTSLIKVRKQAGCAHCQNKEIPELNGYQGREVVMEMLEPSLDRYILRCVMNKDMIGLQEHLEDLDRSPINDPDMTNKTVQECAMYKALQGLLDPRDIEVKTSSFESVERLQMNANARQGRSR